MQINTVGEKGLLGKKELAKTATMIKQVIQDLVQEIGLKSNEAYQRLIVIPIKGVKTISTFLNDIQCLNQKKALKHYAKAYFSNDIRQ